jgi:hypothetical protein
VRRVLGFAMFLLKYCSQPCEGETVACEPLLNGEVKSTCRMIPAPQMAQLKEWYG